MTISLGHPVPLKTRLVAMAGLLARGYSPGTDLPGSPRKAFQWSQDRSLTMALGTPLTVAGAATVSAPFGSSVPCPLLIPWISSVGEPSPTTIGTPGAPGQCRLRPVLSPSGRLKP